MANDPDPYAGKDQILADVTAAPTQSLMSLGNQEDDAEGVYKPRVSADSSKPSAHAQLIGGLTSLLTGDPSIGASVSQHLDTMGIGKNDPMLGQNLQQFSSLLSGQMDDTVKAGQQAESQATQMADKAGKDAAAESAKVNAQLAAQSQKANSETSEQDGGGSGSGLSGLFSF